MQNIEFKAELRDIEAARRQCATLDAEFLGELQQTDTYYKLADGRLKHRTGDGSSGNSGAAGAAGGPSEWIYYHRRDRVSPRMSNFTILSEAEAQRRWGIDRLRPWLRVNKKRQVWMLGNVRVHLDEVEQLGCFIEFEALVTPECDVKQCHAIIGELRAEFEPILGEPVAVSYSDLMDQELAEQGGKP